MDKAFLFAQKLENNILFELEKMAERALPAVKPALSFIITAQYAWKDLFSLEKKGEQYQALNIESLAGRDKEWQQIMTTLGKVEVQDTNSLMSIWMVYAVMERTLQYYQQAAANHAYPSERLFFTSLAKCKLLMKKRIDGMMRIMYNHAWSEVGFAPFILGKD